MAVKPIDSVGREVELLAEGIHPDPHSLLGLQRGMLHLWHPRAGEVEVELQGSLLPAEKVYAEGFYALPVPEGTVPTDYRVVPDGSTPLHDPYSIPPMIEGVGGELYEILGARVVEWKGILGTRFAVFAPNAAGVALVGDFNEWNTTSHPMRKSEELGIWELFLPTVTEKERYQYAIRTKEREVLYKSDPFAHGFVEGGAPASIVVEKPLFPWEDGAWCAKQPHHSDMYRPISIYEVHLGSWKKCDGEFLSYRELAHQLAEYCGDLGYTHVEVLPITEYPHDPSWGYLATGYFAPTSRFGDLADFQYFVNHLHQNDLGVIVDWVPSHFPFDEFALCRFDGSPLYEQRDTHSEWKSALFDFSRPHVQDFLLASALFWLDTCHVDGIRVDSVSSMLYREEGEENREAIAFLRRLNRRVHEKFPKALMIAEDSTTFPKVTHEEGLGFDLKWNLGWMNDTLRLFSTPFSERAKRQQDLTFGLLYGFAEKYMLSLSHDEVVHCKGSLLGRMPGSEEERIAGLKLLLSYHFCYPGKKLLFMGQEFGQQEEWQFAGELPWNLLQDPAHASIHAFVKSWNHLYRAKSPLWACDHSGETFSWLVSEGLVTSYLRKDGDSHLLCVHNFTPSVCSRYRVPLRGVKELEDLLPTGCSADRREEEFVEIMIPPLTTGIYAVHYG